jgi:hypothetical protein
MVQLSGARKLSDVPSLSLTLSRSAEVVVGRGAEAGCARKCWISVWLSAALTPPLGGAGMGVVTRARLGCRAG